MTIGRDLFTSAMSDYWINECHNHISEPLKATWRLMADTFNRSIAGIEEKPWQVLALPTGIGKSIGLAVYCSLQHEAFHPGVLIACRLQVQADAMANLINRLSGRVVAVAYHGKSKHSFAAVRNSPVLAITHSAYENALNAVSKGRVIESNWHMFTDWASGTRKLTVIDEAPNLVESARLPLRDLSVATAFVNGVLDDGAKPELSLLNRITACLCAPGVAGAQNWTEFGTATLCNILPATDPAALLLSLANKLGDLSDHQIAVGPAGLGNQLRSQALHAIASLEMMIDGHKRAEGEENSRTIHTARLMLPETKRPTVILDATAAVDPRYEFAAEWVQIVPVPMGVRSYGNVTLHVSRGNRVGKQFLTDNTVEQWGRVYGELVKLLDGTRRVFVCCHKDVEPKLVGYGDRFASYDVAHWHALDGRNDWQGFDTVVIFGLPYLGNVTLTDWIAVTRDPLDVDVLAETEFGPSACLERKRALRVGLIGVSVIQAINRVRCRQVVDAQGNCRKTDAYILLPDGRDGDDVLSALIDQMPGIQVQDWKLDVVRKRVKRTKHEEPLLRYLEHAKPGTHSVPEVMRSLDIPERTRNRLTKKIKDAASELAIRLGELDVTYMAGGGRGCSSSFVKA